MIEDGHQYQWLTAYVRGRMTGHKLDWANQPASFKDYPAATVYDLPLPELEKSAKKSIFELLQNDGSITSGLTPDLHPLHLNNIAELLLLTSAPTARSTFPQGEIWYRSNASAGALYPIEYYLSTPGGENLPIGTYHYDLLKPALNRLCENLVLEKSGPADRNARPENNAQVSTIILSAVFFRTAWKYRKRAYRYLLLDCGHALENLVLALQFMGLDFETALDFDDLAINQCLNLDEEREVSLAIVRFQSTGFAAKVSEPGPGRAGAASEPVLESPESAKEIIYPSLNEIHRATTSPLLSTTKEKQGSSETATLYKKAANWHKIPENIPVPEAGHSYSESLSRRRSRRNFMVSGKSITAGKLHLLLDLILSDCTTSATRLRPEIVFSVNGVKDVDNGFYLLDFKHRSYGLLERCDRRTKLAAAALDQRWIANAALQFIFFAELEFFDQTYGPRSYRHLNIEAGRLGQRLYLGAAALDLGCCAVGAFYDRELAKVCLLPENFSPLYLVAVGSVAGH
jgi:SagB-type dehydrogenase family enzyme